MSSSIIAEAKYWSEVPAIISKYNALIGENGTTHFFGYASLLDNHNDVKPESSRASPEQGGVADQDARLNGEILAFDVIAFGENAFRAACGTYFDEKGLQNYFANIGAYAGLELSADGYVDGLDITVNKNDRVKAWKAYISRELAAPPEGISFESLLDGTASKKLEAIKGTQADKLGMYKLQIVNIETKQGTVPALTVATNDNSPFEFIEKTPMQIAHLILDGQGYRRPNGNGEFIGGSALDYFKTVFNGRRKRGFKDSKMEQIAAAIEELAVIQGEFGILFEKNDVGEAYLKGVREIEKRHPSYIGVCSPLLHGAREARAEVPDDIKALPENQLAHTVKEKIARTARLRNSGETHFTL